MSLVSSDATSAAATLKAEADELQSLLFDLQGSTKAFNDGYKEEDYEYKTTTTPKSSIVNGKNAPVFGYTSQDTISTRTAKATSS